MRITGSAADTRWPLSGCTGNDNDWPGEQVSAMVRRASCGALVIAAGLYGVPAPAASASGAMLAAACAGCHGRDGVSHGPATPSIAGLSKEYFRDTMQAFKYGMRRGTIMERIAKGYTDDEIKALAGYFSLQTFVAQPQKHDATKAARGRKLHDDSCEKCHENRGRDSEDGGILAGQWAPYLRYQLEDFLAGVNRQPHKMQVKLEALSADDIDALLNFYASQY
jgi:cytochrome subunit of sulfide dehydrogenase